MGSGVRRSLAMWALPPCGLLGLVAWAACAAPRPTWYPAERRVCAPGRVCFRVGPLAPRWRVVQLDRGAIGFFDDASGAAIQVDVSCRRQSDAPLAILAKHLLLGFTEVDIAAQEPLMLDGRAALRTVARARLDGVPRVLDAYVLKRNGCAYDLAYVAPPERWQGGDPEFARFVAGFHDEHTL